MDIKQITIFQFSFETDLGECAFQIPAESEAEAKETLKEALAQMVKELEESIYHRA